MTIDQMIELLEAYRDELGGDTEVRLMTQQSYPFENGISGFASSVEMTDEDACDEDDEDCDDEREVTDGETDTILYIAEGRQIGYGTKAAWEVARR
jgi:hypothetical protein